MAEAFLGEIRMVGFNFAPVGWELCNGQILSINQNQALFALIGTTYGGNGTTTFALPNLQGRVAVHVGSGVGGAVYNWGQEGGSSSVPVTVNNLPAHTHSVAPPVSTAVGTSSGPAAEYPAEASTVIAGIDTATVTTKLFNATATAGKTLAAYPTASTGGGQPLSVQPPYLAIYFIIAMQGIFPSRG